MSKTVKRSTRAASVSSEGPTKKLPTRARVTSAKAVRKPRGKGLLEHGQLTTGRDGTDIDDIPIDEVIELQ